MQQKNGLHAHRDKKGGALGEFGRGQMVSEFEKAAFEAETGQIVGPVQVYGEEVSALKAKYIEK